MAWGAALLKLIAPILKALGLWKVFQAGKTESERDQLEEANKELEKNAEIDSKPVSSDDAYDGLRNFGSRSRDSDNR